MSTATIDGGSRVSYTVTDAANAEKFANYNVQVKLLRLMYTRAPHLATYLEYTVRNATDDDYFIPDSLPAETCLVIDVRIGADLCKKLSCTRMRDREPCTPADVASFYRIGDDAFGEQCQPACFNTRNPAVTYSDSGTQAVHTPMLNFYQNECRIVPDVAVTHLERPYYRSDVHYERRVNDMPTGFSRTTDGTEARYGCGFTYKNNPTYCGYYDRKMEPDGTCTQQWWEEGLNAVTGTALINTVRSGIRTITNESGAPFADPVGLPAFPSIVPERMTVAGWKSDVNAKFVLPDVVTVFDTKADARRRSAAEKQLRQRRASGKIRRQTVADTDPPADVKQSDGADAPTLDKIKQIIESLVDMFRSPETWKLLAESWAFNVSLDYIRQFSLKIIEVVQTSMIRELPKLLDMAFSRAVFAGGMQSVTRTIVINSVVRTLGTSAIMIAKLTAEITSVAGWLIAALTVFDFIFAIWDPYGYKHMFPANYARDFMKAAEISLRSQFQTPSLQYGYDELLKMFITHDEFVQVFIESLVDRIVYLDALEVNSDGETIDKSDYLFVDKRNANADQLNGKLDEISKIALARRARFDPVAYGEYNATFVKKITFSNAMVYAAAGCATISAAFIIAGWLVLSVLSFVICIICMIMNRLTVTGGGGGGTLPTFLRESYK